MINRRNPNSILVLATLGVYFGLVLVGATPQILAQAAMTREFNVKDEIETRDKLDKKPDDKRSPVNASVQLYLEDVEYFLASLERLRSRGKFDPAKDSFDVAQSTLLPCVDAGRAGRFTPIRFNTSSESTRPALDQFTRGMAYGYSLGDCIVNSEFEGLTAVDSRFNFKLDGKAFFVNVAVRKDSPQRSIELIRDLESTLQLYSRPDASKVRQKIIESTRFTATNDQVFVVTNLPRAGLDPLLAVNVK